MKWIARNYNVSPAPEGPDLDPPPVYATVSDGSPVRVLAGSPAERMHPTRPGDVLIWYDADRSRLFCSIPGAYASCPTRRTRRITLNCCRYALKWI